MLDKMDTICSILAINEKNLFAYHLVPLKREKGVININQEQTTNDK